MKFNKKILSIFFIALLTIVLAACGGTTTTQVPTTGTPTTTEEPINLLELVDALEAQYADTLGSETFLATEDLTLVNEISGVTITWSSSNTDYLANDGTITRPSYTMGDQTVILTATLTAGDDSEDVAFFVTVKALDKSDQERANEVFLVVTAFPTKEKWTSADSDDLEFLTTGQDLDANSYTVVWTSSHPDVISVAGEITQPFDADVTVTMTATITINSVDYTKTVDFVVAKVVEPTAVTSITEAMNLYLTNNVDEYYGYTEYVMIPGLTVIGVTSAGIYVTDGTEIIYVYAPPFELTVGSVYDITGQIKLYYNAWELDSSDNEPLRAVASTAAVSLAPVTVATSIYDVIADMVSPTYATPFANTKYTVTAAVYYEETWGNYSVFLVPVGYDFDAALAEGATQPNGDSIMIYYPSDDENLQAFHGQVVTVDIIMQGYRTDKLVWYSVFFGDATAVDVATDAELLQFAADAVDTTVSGATGEVLTFPLEGILGSTIAWDMSTVVTVGGTYDSVTGELLLPDVAAATDFTVVATVSLGTETPLTVNVVVSVIPLTDAEKLAAAQTALETGVAVKGYDVVDLPLTGLYGTTVSWSVVSGDATLDVDGTTLTYAYSATAYDVVLQATLSIGTETPVTKDFTVTVSTFTIVTDFAALHLMTDGTNYDVTGDIYIKGIVTGNSYDGLFIQDTNGVGFFLYRPDLDGTMVVGDEVIYFGTLGAYNGARQLGKGADLIVKLSTGNTVTSNVFTAADIIAIDGTDAGKLISFTGLEVKLYDGSHVTFTVTDGVNTRDVMIRYYTNFAPWLPDVYPVGSTLPAVEFIIYNFRSDIAQFDLLSIEPTDAQAIQLDADELPATLSLVADYVVPTPLYGSTYTVTGITGDAAAYLDYTTTPGTILVTQPLDADKVGQITIQVTLGIETAIDVVIDVTVKMPAPPANVFFSEYAEGSSSNKWLEIYNGTGAVLDLTGYSVVVYSNGSTTAAYTLDLTGTVAIGDVYVITNASAELPNVIAESDITSSVTYYNGDDAVALLKDGVVVDLIGVIGEDPGSSWIVGTGATGEYTLVRKATVTGPTATFDPTQWDVYAQNTETYVGSHTVS
ncbi:MAG: lamin tail domain-containing protein [Candidatus Izemoplasmatales bacterium]|nr:lamin tail domain-containing protein [Candidatus Izemoplasmatales bacterium]